MGTYFSEWNGHYTNWVDFIMYNNMILQHEKICLGAVEMTWWVKHLPHKPEEWQSDPSAHVEASGNGWQSTYNVRPPGTATGDHWSKLAS